MAVTARSPSVISRSRCLSALVGVCVCIFFPRRLHLPRYSAGRRLKLLNVVLKFRHLSQALFWSNWGYRVNDKGISSKRQGVGLFSKLLVAMSPVSTRLLAIMKEVRICRECFQSLPVSSGNVPETSGRPVKVYDFAPRADE